jgi:hypothetical protein
MKKKERKTMANEQNLIPQAHTLSVEEASRGGKASGESRRKMKNLKMCLEYLAQKPVTNERIKKAMSEFGIPEDEMTIEMAGALKIAAGFMSGDHRAVQEYMKGTGQEIIKNVNENHNIEYKPLVDLTKRKKNGQE